jgi:hypothetical protein
MSCFIVLDKHISAIVRYAKDHKLWVDGHSQDGCIHDANQEDQACNLLYAANVQSLNERYGEDNAIKHVKFSFTGGGESLREFADYTFSVAPPLVIQS